MGITSFTLIGSEVPDRAIPDRVYTVARGGKGVNRPRRGTNMNAQKLVERVSGTFGSARFGSSIESVRIPSPQSARSDSNQSHFCDGRLCLEKLGMLDKVLLAQIHGLFGDDPFPAFLVRTLGKGRIGERQMGCLLLPDASKRPNLATLGGDSFQVSTCRVSLSTLRY